MLATHLLRGWEKSVREGPPPVQPAAVNPGEQSDARSRWSRRLVSKPPVTPSDLGQRVRIRRKTIGMTQVELASSLGISFQQMQKYEKGINAISAARLRQICDALSLPHDFFEVTSNPLIGKADGDGAADQPSDRDDVQLFVESREGQRLIRSFMRITDKRLRTRILDFVTSVSEDGG